MQREYRYDNIKAFLIFCVVFGHMIEGSSHDMIRMLYTLIYSFHMPLFVFLSGMFARFDPQRIVRRLLLPYLIFQTIYSVGGFPGNAGLHYTTPFWILWYLLSMVIWHMLVPFIEGGSRRKKAAVFFGSVLVALLTGYDASVGYWMSASRTVVFFPFFVMGYYYGHSEFLKSFFEKINKYCVIGAGGAAALVICFFSDRIDARWLYGSYHYQAINYSIACRLLCYLFAFVLGAAVLKIFPERESCLSCIGQHTMPVYLVHAVCVMAAKYCIFERVSWSENQELALASAFSFLIVWMLAKTSCRHLRYL